MKFENTDIWGFEHALRGARNPKNSWDKSDSIKIYWDGEWFTDDSNKKDYFTKFGINYNIGENDLDLAQRLIKAGPEHRKFLRQIFVSVDITAPLYWWKEFDTYKIGTTANSTSTMHKIASKPITINCFEIDDLNEELCFDAQNDLSIMDNFIPFLEKLRLQYREYVKESANKELSLAERKLYARTAKLYWKELIRWLPESWLQMRTVTMNYENLYTIIRQRYNHKLNEWSGKDDPELDNFIKWVRTLPYAEEFLFMGMENKEE